MIISIRVFKEPGAEPELREIEAGITIEDLLAEYRSHLPYRIITARIGSEEVSLTYIIEKECDVTFCDIRDDVAFRSYQRGLILLMLKAARSLWGKKAKVMIRNSVNRGIFASIVPGDSGRSPGRTAPTEADLRQIEKLMWQMIDANKQIRVVGDHLYKLDNFTCMFYGLLPPSTGYLYSFALEAMRDGVLLRYPHPSDPLKLAIYKKDARVFDAYDEEQKFLDELNLGTVSGLNRQISAGAAPDIIRIAEARHRSCIEDIAQKIIDSKSRVVLLAGPSSSGKTTTAKRLVEALEGHGIEEPLYFGTDDYYVEREFMPKDKKGEFNFEGLDAIDIELFSRNINELLSGKTADLPKYDFLTGSKVFGRRKSKLKKDQIIFVEGIHALNKKFSASLADNIKFRIYISPLTQLNLDDNNRVPSTEVRFLRRLVRDHRTRGCSVMETIKIWPKVRAGETVNIFPYNNEADVIFNSTLVYEIPVLRKHVASLLEEVPADDPAYGTAKRLLNFLSFFTSIEDESEIPGDSILREFIGGSRFGY